MIDPHDYELTDEEHEALLLKSEHAIAPPQAAPPTQRQLLMLATLYWPEGDDLLPAVRFARAVLARWGCR